MLWSRRDSRSLRNPPISLPLNSQKASPLGGSVATRIDNPSPSSVAPVATSSRFPLSPLNPQSTPPSSSQSKPFDHNATSSPSALAHTQPRSAEMNSVQIGRRITNNFGDDAAPMPPRRRSISNRQDDLSRSPNVSPMQQTGVSHRHVVVLSPSQMDATCPPALVSPSPRRPSMPSASHPPFNTSLTAPSTEPPPIAVPSTSDEIYRDLSTYTFGAARPPLPSPSPSYDADVEFDKAISPLTPLPRKVSVDRTPRSSIVAMTQGQTSHASQSHGNERIPSVPFRSPPWDLDGITSTLASSVRNCESSDAQDSDDADEPSEFSHDHESHRIGLRPLIPRGDPVQSDTASRHTFGGRGINSSSASISSVTSASRPHSPTSSRMESSSDDDNTGFTYRAGRASLPAYARLDASDAVDDEEEIDVGLGHDPPQDPLGRRGSLPLPIPGAVSTDRGPLADDQDSNIASHRRPSRSLDDDMNLHALADPPITIGPRSQPSSKGDWVSLQFQSQDQGMPGSDPFAGLNLGYILGGQDVSGFRRSSDAPSYVQPIRKGSQNSQIFSFGLGLGRRSSTATTISGAEDTFLRHLNKYNEGYGAQISFWTFKKEKADGGSRPSPGPGTFPSPRGSISETTDTRAKGKEKSSNLGMVPGTQEIWKCENVGRFKVDRQTYRPDPAKPPQQRVNVRHILDPYSRGNTRGGPAITIHKHSRAVAFSIYRAHSLVNRDRVRPGVLLAPKKVQERYTSTLTTARLVTHGLLDDRGRHRSSMTPHRTSSLMRRDKDRKKTAEDTAKAKLRHRPDKGNENQNSPGESSRSQDPLVPSKDTPVSDVTNTEAHPPLSHMVVLEQRKDPYQRRESNSDQSTIKSLYTYGDRRDSWDERPPSRTPHAETYGTLDSSIIQYVRAKPDRLLEPDPHPSFFRWLLRPLPRSGLQTSSNVAGLTSAQLEGNYRPPWMAMAPRARQEETDRVIHNLNNSFKGVGLLPASSKPTLKHKKSARLKPQARVDILEHVPEESLYMLLPLWPGETDTLSSVGISSSVPNVPTLEERHYLLVYYVPRLEKAKDGGQSLSKRRSRTSQTSSGDSTSPSDDRSIILSEFHVCARLVSYNELRGSGVRLPSDGLSVTGPMWEAVQSIPDPANLKGHQSDWVIAIYHGRERGVELVPGGLTELGLGLPTPPRNPPLYPLREEECDETQEALLSPMGRAAVEMAWAGCIALSSFGPC